MSTMPVFDFDGVLFDSNPETCVSAYNTITGELAKSYGELPDEYIELFNLNRSRAKNAGDMCSLAKWALANLDFEKRILARDEFQQLVLSPNTEDLGPAFFSKRNDFLNADRDSWLSLMSPYDKLFQYLISAKASPLIVTYKNREAVLELCNHFGLHLDNEKLFTGDGSTSKITNFNELRRKFPAENYVFIDDAVKNLVQLNEGLDFKVDYVYASWGYGARDDEEYAVELGFKVMDEEQVIEMLKGLQK